MFEVDHILRTGETLPSSSYKRLAGGKGANQSVACARASEAAKVSHLGQIGDDGKWIVHDIVETAGVDVRYVGVSQSDMSGRAIIQVSKSSGDNAIILYPGSNKTISVEFVDKCLDELGDELKEGWLMLQNEVNLGEYVMEKCFDMGMIVVFNPAPMTPNVYKDFHQLKFVHLLILNETEATGLINQMSSDNFIAPTSGNNIVASMTIVIDKLSELVHHNVAGIVITLGGDGLVSKFRDGNGWYSVQMPAIPTMVVDTTGAGDTFVGYLVATLSSAYRKSTDSAPVRFSRKLVEAALKRSTMASSVKCRTAGAMTSIPRLEQVLEFEKQQ